MANPQEHPGIQRSRQLNTTTDQRNFGPSRLKGADLLQAIDKRIASTKHFERRMVTASDVRDNREANLEA
ncbi:hypothetical protein PENFLA_c040G00622 [Penicillium flavigenum]|uniref:Uncharacterized protein n=1 Tax=Penicillium flavigenum TaxID=254877 RepID=A0A1V6SJH0_9EURO|nr:hypothetical protein PENFLA_c040G00622 [Penicillium flavigenum]